MVAKIKVTPRHGVCQTNVAVPTLLVEPLNSESETPEVFLQWFGESERVDLEGMQFRFPVPCSPNDVHWMGHPERFKVVFVGQVKDWPNSDAVDLVAKTIRISHDSWVLYVVSTHFTMRYPSGEGPGSFVVSMSVKLADGVCGIIEPKKYCDMSVLEVANRTVATMSVRA